MSERALLPDPEIVEAIAEAIADPCMLTVVVAVNQDLPTQSIVEVFSNDFLARQWIDGSDFGPYWHFLTFDRSMDVPCTATRLETH